MDDERPAPDSTWIVRKTSADAVETLAATSADLDEVSLDHDLGGDDTGMRVIDFMIQHGIWPHTLTIHTANPVGRQNLLRAANAEAPPEVEIYVKTW